MIMIDNKYEIGEIVFLKTDLEQLPRIVTCVKVFAQGELTYELSQGAGITQHYEFEITKEKITI